MVMVSICCITFNHEAYIRQCLDGFLLQQTTFKYEVLIHDDCSTDNTAAIIKEYEALYPGRFKTIFQTENQYSKGVRGIIGRFLLPLASGKYIAICEGDDYWTDPDKLQKQVAFLEHHSEYSFVCGGFIENNTDLNSTREVVKDPLRQEQYLEPNAWEITYEDMKHDWVTKTLTCLFRKDRLNVVEMLKYVYFRDVVLFFMLMKSGKGLYMSGILGVYHVHSGGVHSGTSLLKRVEDNYQVYHEMYLLNPENDFARFRVFKSNLQLMHYRKTIGNMRWIAAVKDALSLAKTASEKNKFFKILLKTLVKTRQ